MHNSRRQNVVTHGRVNRKTVTYAKTYAYKKYYICKPTLALGEREKKSEDGNIRYKSKQNNIFHINSAITHLTIVCSFRGFFLKSEEVVKSCFGLVIFKVNSIFCFVNVLLIKVSIAKYVFKVIKKQEEIDSTIIGNQIMKDQLEKKLTKWVSLQKF